MATRRYSKTIIPRIEKLLEHPLISEDRWAQDQFLPSIKNQMVDRGSLTVGQYEWLVKLEEKFSDENSLKLEARRDALKKEREEREAKEAASLEEWKEVYFNSAILQEKGRIMAEYYKNWWDAGNNNLYESIRNSISAGELPRKPLFMTMIGNKYAEKVLNEWFREPEFPHKSIAVPRKKKQNDRRSPLYKVPFVIVLKTNTSIPGIAKGSKKLLCVAKGGPFAFECEERDLKHYRRKQK